MPSAALELFDEIMADPVVVLDRMIAEKQPETEFLEFKGGGITKAIDQAKAYFSEVLSAFANTSGGVLVFGIDSRRNPETKSEGENKKVLVPDATELRNQLWARRLEATTSSIIGLRIEPVKVEGETGYVVCYVPEGTAKPYRAEFADAKYFTRNGDSNTVMPHAVLRSMFYPQVQPYLACSYWCAQDAMAEYRCGVWIKNIGNATAEELLIRCGFYCDNPITFDAIAPLNISERSRYSQRLPTVLTAQKGIHPGETLELIGNSLAVPIGFIGIDLRIYSKNALARRQRISMPKHLRYGLVPQYYDFEEVDIDFRPGDKDWGD
jgi:hypothetical protein